jgi:uncharacterized protein (DUF433 family)
MSVVKDTQNLPVAAYPHLTRIAGVRGGNAIVEGTRIGVHDVLGLLQGSGRVSRSHRCAAAR